MGSLHSRVTLRIIFCWILTYICMFSINNDFYFSHTLPAFFPSLFHINMLIVLFSEKLKFQIVYNYFSINCCHTVWERENTHSTREKIAALFCFSVLLTYAFLLFSIFSHYFWIVNLCVKLISCNKRDSLVDN